MRCHSCRGFSLSPICSGCRQIYLNPVAKTRVLSCGLEVVSFFGYEDIEPFLLTKHYSRGWFIYRMVAKAAFRDLKECEEDIAVIAIDDEPKGGYSHTALLAREIAMRGYKPLYGKLKAKKRVSYSGKPLSFRLKNPREFNYCGPRGIEAVLVDDIVTTGLTLQEAQQTLLKFEVEVKRAFVLADADRR